MFTLDLNGKHDIITHLTLQCLERHAKGFYLLDTEASSQTDFSDWLNELEFHRDDRTVYEEVGQRIKQVDLLSLNRFRISKQASGGMALLVRSPDGPVCCAGGLSLTLITEWVLYQYLTRYADLLGDLSDKLDLSAQFENMRERVEVVLKNSSAIRCCIVNHCYAGYVTLPRRPAELDQRAGEIPADYCKRFRLALEQNDLYTVSGTRWMREQKFYGFTREHCSMKVYLLDRCYGRNQRPVPAAQVPAWARKAVPCVSMGALLPAEDSHWQTLDQTLPLEDGTLYLSPVARLYAHQCLSVLPGRYRVIWHETDGQTDRILLIHQETGTRFFDATKDLSPSLPLAGNIRSFCKEHLLFRSKWKLQKATHIGLASHPDALQGNSTCFAADESGPQRIATATGALGGITFSRVPHRDFRLGLASGHDGAAPHLICLYTA